MTERDNILLTKIIAERVARSASPRERATLIFQQMAHWPGLVSEEGWTIVIETLLADRDKVAAQLAKRTLEYEALLTAWVEARAALERINARVAELEQHILMLTSLPTWKPVEDGFTHLCGCIDCAAGDPDGWHWQLYVNNGRIGIEDPDNKDDDRWVLLPDGVRLCSFTRGERS